MEQNNDSVLNKFVNNLPFEMHLYDPIVGKYAAAGPGTHTKERIKKYVETGDTNFIYKNELDKNCFYHDVAYSKHKDVQSRLIHDKKLMEAAIQIANDSSKNGYERALASLVAIFFNKKIQAGVGIRKKSKHKL